MIVGLSVPQSFLYFLAGPVAIVLWAGARLFTRLGASLSVLVKTLPLLLFFSLVSFFTTEIWQVFTSTGAATYRSAIGMFLTLGTVFLITRLPRTVRELQADSPMGGFPLRRRERLNLAIVALTTESLHVLFVSAAVWFFYVVLGLLLVPADVRAGWLLQSDTVLWNLAWFGERVQITAELLRVATGIAAFAGLYYAVTILVDSAYRDRFTQSLGEELRDAFDRRTEYLRLLGHRHNVTKDTDTELMAGE